VAVAVSDVITVHLCQRPPSVNRSIPSSFEVNNEYVIIPYVPKRLEEV
jgi:hypothetical protein